MKIDLGFGFDGRKARHPVRAPARGDFSYSRSRSKLKRLARQAKGRARRHSAEAGSHALLVAVHWSRIDDVLKQAGICPARFRHVLASMNDDDTGLTSAAPPQAPVALARKVVARVVSAFGTVSEVLFSVFERRRRRPARPRVLQRRRAAGK